MVYNYNIVTFMSVEAVTSSDGDESGFDSRQRQVGQ